MQTELTELKFALADLKLDLVRSEAEFERFRAYIERIIDEQDQRIRNMRNEQ